PWVRGAAVVQRPTELWDTADGLSRFVTDHALTFLNLPTAYFNDWVLTLGERPPGVRGIAIGGEAANVERVRRWQELPGTARLWNAYGPTEATVTAT
ncbi:AMP-binding protein, partial [Klebsiella pneumoniae]|uniref:AMP-binding protein n=1 Tax=Klebsiella pneumoniae TaxID=573 RepID=UPI002730340C